MSNLGPHIFRFGTSAVDGRGSMTALLGGKGAGLAEMTRLGLPVPPGFTISTEACRSYLKSGRVSEELQAQIVQAMRWLEAETGKRFGDAQSPLLVSVRSGAPVSMPGMMDTILNVGLNDKIVRGLEAVSTKRNFAFDSYRRFLQMFGSVVLEIPKDFLNLSGSVGPEQAALFCKDAINRCCGKSVPQNPAVQLAMAVEAVFHSWQSDRAVFYRKLNHIEDTMGTAVTVQAMVFGNLSINSGTGVGFTRNPSTGEPVIFGEYIANAQGEDIVAGTHTPMPLIELQRVMPAIYEQLLQLSAELERHYRDVQDFEFTVEDDKLYLLQTRAAKRSALASVRIAVDLAREGLLTQKEAVGMVNPASIAEVLLPQFQLGPDAPQPIAKGLPAAPGAATGMIALSASSALSMHSNGNPVVLVTEETMADDIQGMAASVGFLTARGGATSHAAVVARGMGRTCVTGARDIAINLKLRTVSIAGKNFCEGEWISLDGSTGNIFPGRLALSAAVSDQPELDLLLDWACAISECEVRANADTPEDAKASLACGAAGIGLCRTEHMFFAEERLRHMREMILAKCPSQRIAALEHLLSMQQADFTEIFRSMSPLPVTIRLLDPPLHEFLPLEKDISKEILQARSDENWERCVALEEMRRRAEDLAESNPMMGHRGCRLSITYPEILKMQVRAILQAAITVGREGKSPRPEIMVPLVSLEQEIRVLADGIRAIAEEVFAELGQRIEYRIGAMIELPRAAICARDIAKHVSFVSFGTNDLTQMTYGFSRDDIRHYLDSYLKQGILASDPFVTIDREGVGQLMKMAVLGLRAVNPEVKIGICGEHGGDPESIDFFQSLGVDYVSCSPARLQIAQLAVAQAETSRQRLAIYEQHAA